MKKVVTPFIFAISFFCASFANANVILTFEPGVINTKLGETVSTNLLIDGLGDGFPLSLGAFDVNVAYDSSVLSFAGYNLYDDLGNLDFFEAIDTSFGDLGGIVNISEISLLLNFELWAFQPSSFALAELVFTVEALTSSSGSNISVDAALLSDTNGDLINIVAVNDATIVAVPTPASSALMGIALLALFSRKIKRS